MNASNTPQDALQLALQISTLIAALSTAGALLFGVYSFWRTDLRDRGRLIRATLLDMQRDLGTLISSLNEGRFAAIGRAVADEALREVQHEPDRKAAVVNFMKTGDAFANCIYGAFSGLFQVSEVEKQVRDLQQLPIMLRQELPVLSIFMLKLFTGFALRPALQCVSPNIIFEAVQEPKNLQVFEEELGRVPDSIVAIRTELIRLFESAPRYLLDTQLEKILKEVHEIVFVLSKEFADMPDRNLIRCGKNQRKRIAKIDHSKPRLLMEALRLLLESGLKSQMHREQYEQVIQAMARLEVHLPKAE